MKQKLLFLLVLLLTATTGTWAQDYYAPSTDEVIILNEVYNASKSGNSSHSAIAWGGTATASKKKAGDPNMGGQSTSSNVNCYSVKGTGKGKNITLSITGVSKVIVYHQRGNTEYIELRDGSKNGNIIGSGQTNTFYTEVALTATNQYSIFLHGTDGSHDQDFYVYAIKLIAAPAAAGYTVSLKDGVKDADKWTVKAGTDGSFQSLPLKGVKAGTKVKLKYDGDRSMLKGVKATSDAKPAATVKTITIAADFHTSGNVATAPEITIEYNEGEKWSDVAARYDWLKTYEDFTVYYYADSKSGDLHTADGGVKPSDLVDPNKSYYWGYE